MSVSTIAIRLRVWSVLPFWSIQTPPKRQNDEKPGGFAAVDTIGKRDVSYAKRIIPYGARRCGSYPRERKRDRPRAGEVPARWRGDTWQLDRQNNREWDPLR